MENRIYFSGRDLCAWQVGRERADHENLNGDCENCKYLKCLGVHYFCAAAATLSPHNTYYDCAVTSIKSDKDNNVRCLNCDRHLNPKTVRCEECLKTYELVNFKPQKPGKLLV